MGDLVYCLVRDVGRTLLDIHGGAMMNGKSSLILPVGDRWQHRAVRETGGNTTLMGCYVLAVLGWQHGRKPPRLGKVARIDLDGVAWSNMQNKSGHMFRDHCLGPLQDIVDSFRGLADHLKLNDVERVEMFAELRKWFAVDQRANKGIL